MPERAREGVYLASFSCPVPDLGLRVFEDVRFDMRSARCSLGSAGVSARLSRVLFDEPKTVQDISKYRTFLRELLRKRTYGAMHLFNGFGWQNVAHQIDRVKEADVMDGPHLCTVQAVAVRAYVSTLHQGAQREAHGMWRQDALFGPVL